MIERIAINAGDEMNREVPDEISTCLIDMQRFVTNGGAASNRRQMELEHNPFVPPRKLGFNIEREYTQNT